MNGVTVLKNVFTESNTKEIVAKVGSFDWGAFVNAGGTFYQLTISANEIQDEHKLFYQATASGEDLSDFIGDIVAPDSADNLIKIGTAEKFVDNFVAMGGATAPPNDWTTGKDYMSSLNGGIPYYWKHPVQSDKFLEVTGDTYSSSTTYYKSYDATVLFETTSTTGHVANRKFTVGASVGVTKLGTGSSAPSTYVLNVGAESIGYLGGIYQQSLTKFGPAIDGTQICNMSQHPTRNHSNVGVGYDIELDEDGDIKTPTRFVLQLLFTEIDSYEYIGLAAIVVDANNKPISCAVNFLPKWFWGDFEGPDYDPTSSVPTFYGLDSEPGGTGGSYIFPTELIGVPSSSGEQPFSQMTSTGKGIHVYGLTETNIAELESALWNTDGDLWTQFKNYKFNPIGGIISCIRIPKAIMRAVKTAFNNNIPTDKIRLSGTALQTSQCGYLNAHTLVDYSVCTNFQIESQFSSYLNWRTKIRLFLPFCGWVDLNPSAVVAGSLSITYKVDITTGDCMAYVITTDKDGRPSGTITASGNLGVPTMITGNDNGFSEKLSSFSRGVSSFIKNPTPIGALTTFAGIELNNAITPEHTQTAGQFSNNMGQLGERTAYLEITYPIEHRTELHRELNGLPGSEKVTIEQLKDTGYTEISDIFIDSSDFTSAEKEELKQLLRGGVFL